MKKSAFQSRLFLAYATLTAAVVVAFAVLLIGITSGMNRETELNHQRELLEKNLRDVEGMIEQMDSLASQVISNNEFINYFIPLAADGDMGNYFEANLIDSIRAGSQLATINGVENLAARISAFNQYGDYVSTGTLYETREAKQRTLSDQEAIQALADLVAADPQRRAVIGPAPDMWSNNPNARVITLLRALSSTYAAKSYGLLAVQQDLSVFDGYSFFRQDGGMPYVLIDGEGQAIYPEDPALQGYAAIFEAALKAEAGERAASFRMSFEGGEKLVLVSPVAMTPWRLLRVMPASALDAPYLKIYVFLGLFSLALLLILLWVVYVMAGRISRPLRALAASVKNVNLNHMELVGETPAKNASEELIALDEAFRSMLSRLNQSIGLEMKAYMLALQSQMSPHFLYNMLSVIIESGEEEGSARTVKMCERLSYMLRYIADYTGDTVTLMDELNHTRNYLALMKERYEESFAYEIEADEGIERVRVPKLILQPLTENCFNHGFKRSRPPWYIGVAVRAEGGKWSIEVRDNGIGMTDEDILAVNERIDTYRQNLASNYAALRVGSMGLVNTVLRLTLLQDEPILFEIGRAPEGGTRITIGGRIDDQRADRGRRTADAAADQAAD